MPTYRIDVEYEGTRYRGWQLQQNARSVAGELQRAIREAGAVCLELGGAGRTDAGVHALQQTAHLRLKAFVDERPFRDAVNAHLPHDVHVLTVTRAADGFHARHDAVSRSYLYQISRRRTALAKRGVWWPKRDLDVDVMARAAQLVVGRHDFVRFCERPQEQSGTVVVVERAEVAPADDVILVRLVASHFLWKMVRRLVGTLVRIGSGEVAAEQLQGALARPTARGALDPAAWTAPPSGLYLERVVYPGEPAIGALVPVLRVARLGAVGYVGAAAARGAKPVHTKRPGTRTRPGRHRSAR